MKKLLLMLLIVGVSFDAFAKTSAAVAKLYICGNAPVGTTNLVGKKIGWLPQVISDITGKVRDAQSLADLGIKSIDDAKKDSTNLTNMKNASLGLEALVSKKVKVGPLFIEPGLYGKVFKPKCEAVVDEICTSGICDKAKDASQLLGLVTCPGYICTSLAPGLVTLVVDQLPASLSFVKEPLRSVFVNKDLQQMLCVPTLAQKLDQKKITVTLGAGKNVKSKDITIFDSSKVNPATCKPIVNLSVAAQKNALAADYGFVLPDDKDAFDEFLVEMGIE